MAMALIPPSAWIAATLRSSVRVMQSQSTLPLLERTCRARCPMANLGSLAMLISSGASTSSWFR
jgi:hypothetical protein